MSELPSTPAQWADYIDDASTRPDRAQHLLDELRANGFTIVHPDDVPEKGYGGPVDDGYITGWNACRRQIFGDGA